MSRARIDSKEELNGLRFNFRQRLSIEKIPFEIFQIQKRHYRPHNNHQTDFCYEKIYVVRQLQNLVTVSIIMAGYFSSVYEFNQLQSTPPCVVLSTMVTFLTVLYFIIRILEVRLNRLVSIIEINTIAKVSIFGKYMIKWIPSVVFLVHPNYLFYRVRIFEENYTTKQMLSSSFRRNFNEYLFIFQITLLFGKFFINILRMSDFSKSRVRRLTRIFHFACSTKFVLKCHLRQNTLKTVLAFLIIVCVYLTIVFCVTEAPLTTIPNNSGNFFSEAYNILESLYFCFGTLLLFGNGEILASSNFGKLVCAIACYAGAFAIPTIALSVQNKFKMNEAQGKVAKLQYLKDLITEKESIISQVTLILFQNEDLIKDFVRKDMRKDAKIQRFSVVDQSKLHILRERFRRFYFKLKNAMEPPDAQIAHMLTQLVGEMNSKIEILQGLKNLDHSIITEKSAFSLRSPVRRK
jgi:hypothetical protein